MHTPPCSRTREPTVLSNTPCVCVQRVRRGRRIFPCSYRTTAHDDCWPVATVVTVRTVVSRFRPADAPRTRKTPRAFERVPLSSSPHRDAISHTPTAEIELFPTQEVERRSVYTPAKLRGRRICRECGIQRSYPCCGGYVCWHGRCINRKEDRQGYVYPKDNYFPPPWYYQRFVPIYPVNFRP
ncbi:uncharacterized protein LOC142582922 isoform X1 [Dermacentor variabilis]|uniref:uncharacterized protein LOC142582922 isoform X1 n=1 Tax=Dermacentor variabilis TaxID=34621 RepID=UPI003F5CB6FE